MSVAELQTPRPQSHTASDPAKNKTVKNRHKSIVVMVARGARGLCIDADVAGDPSSLFVQKAKKIQTIHSHFHGTRRCKSVPARPTVLKGV
jgi:hypothetical protein